MGKNEEKNGTTTQMEESTILAKNSSEASKMLEAALLQMDDIISGMGFKFILILNIFYHQMDILFANITDLLISNKFRKGFLGEYLFLRISYLSTFD